MNIWNTSDQLGQNTANPILMFYGEGSHVNQFPGKLWLIALLIVMLGIFYVFSVSANVVVLLAFYFDRGLRQPSNFFIVGLAMADLITVLISQPVCSQYLLLERWYLGPFFCDLWLSLDWSLLVISPNMVFLITLDRYLSVKRPIMYRKWRTKNRVRIMIALAWIFPTIYLFSIIIGWQRIVGKRAMPSHTCGVVFLDYYLFIYAYCVTDFWFVFFAIGYMYVGMYRVALDIERKAQLEKNKIAPQKMESFKNSLRVSFGAEQWPDHISPSKEDTATDYRRRSADISIKDVNSIINNACDLAHTLFQASLGSPTGGPPPAECLVLPPYLTSDVDDETIPRQNSYVGLVPPVTQKTRRWDDGIVELLTGGPGPASATDHPDDVTASLSFRQEEDHRDDQSMAINRTGNDRSRTQISINNSGNNLRCAPKPLRQDGPSELQSTAATSSPRELKITDSVFTIEDKSKKKCSSCCLSSNKKKKSSDSDLTTAGFSDDFKRPRPGDKKRKSAFKSPNVQKAVRTITIILGTFVLFLSPYQTGLIIFSACESCIPMNLMITFYYFSYVRALANPFCYAFANAHFKKTCQRIVTLLMRRRTQNQNVILTN